jgi:hypothetical protein
MRVNWWLVVLLLSSPAAASDFGTCTVQGEVLRVEPARGDKGPVLVIKPQLYSRTGTTRCGLAEKKWGELGGEARIEMEIPQPAVGLLFPRPSAAISATPVPGERVEVSRSCSSGMGPKGVVGGCSAWTSKTLPPIELSKPQPPPVGEAPTKPAVPGKLEVSWPALAVMGSIDRESITRVLAAHRPQILDCFAQQTKEFPWLEGTVSVKFVFNQTGTVLSAQVAQSTISHPGVETCLSGEIKKWSFPKTKGGGVGVVTCPLVFTRPEK